MATIAKQEVEVVKTFHGGPPIVVNFPEAATQTFKRGELVSLVSGKVTLGTVTGVFLGMALKDASGVTDTNMPVILCTADTVFAANLTAAQATAQTQLGGSFGLAITTAKWHIDSTVVGANARVLIVDFDKRDVLGDVAGRLHFVVLSKFRLMDSSS